MANDLDSMFTRPADRMLIGRSTYQVYDWEFAHRLSFPTIEITFGLDGYQELAEHAALGRAVTVWRARNSELAALLDAEAVLDALAGRHH